MGKGKDTLIQVMDRQMLVMGIDRQKGESDSHMPRVGGINKRTREWYAQKESLGYWVQPTRRPLRS